MSRVPPTLESYIVPQHVLEVTGDLLRDRGVLGLEAVVLWLGRIDGPRNASITTAVRPAQIAYRSDDGCAVEVPPDALSEIVRMLPDGMFVLVRLHSHPDAAYHSPVDDTNMLIAHQGAISIVVPDFAAAPIDLLQCSVNELRQPDGWRELAAAEVQRRFEVR